MWPATGGLIKNMQYAESRLLLNMLLKMETLKQLLKQECDFPISDRVLDLLLSRAETVNARRGERLIDMGQRSMWLWILKDGVIRLFDRNGEKERTYAFACPGSVFMSKHSFVMRLPTYYEMEACCPSVLLRVSRSDVDELLAAEHEFALWMLHLAWVELYYQEKKNSTVANGAAYERLQTIYRERPEIISQVKQKHIASYLGISVEYYTRLKKKFLSHK